MTGSMRMVKLLRLLTGVVAGSFRYGKARSRGALLACLLLAASSLASFETAAAGTLYFSGVNTHWDNATTKDWSTSSAGPFTSLWSSGSDALFVSPAQTVTVTQGIPSVNSLTFAVTGYTLTGGSINLTGSGGSIGVGTGSATINSILTGSNGLTKTGTGLLTLGGANTYANGTTISGGSLSVGSTARLGSGPVTLAGTLVYGGTVANNLIVGASTVSLAPSGGSATMLSGSLTGSGVVDFSGPAASQTFMAGDLSAFGGTLAFGTTGSGVWFNGSTGTAAAFIAGTGDVLAFASTAVGARTYNLGELTGAAGSRIYTSSHTANTITLSIGALNVSSTFAGTIQNDALSPTDATSTIGLTKVGSGGLTLSGSNTFTGLTAINSGVLGLGSSGALAGTGSITFGGGTLQFSAKNTRDYAARVVASTAAIAIDTNGQGVTFAGRLAASNSGGLTKLGAGALTLAASEAYSGNTTISGGTLQIGNGGSGASIGATPTVLDNACLVFNHGDSVSFAAVITGSGSLTQAGSGRLSLTNSNSYSGGTTLSGGTLSPGNAASLGSGPIMLAGGTLLNGTTLANNMIAAVSTTSTITPTSGSSSVFSGSLAGSGVVNFSGGGGVQTFVNGDLSVFRGTLGFGTSGSRVWFNGSTGTATIFNAGAGDIFAFASTAVGTQTYNLGALSGAAGSHIYSSPGTGNAVTLSIGAVSISSSFAGTIQDDSLSATDTTSIIGLSKVGSGTFTLSGSNTYTGVTAIDAGVLALGNGAALAGNGYISFGGGTLQFSAKNTQDCSTRIVASTAPIAIDTNGQSVIFAGTLASSNTGGLTKLGGGTLTLVANEAYSGNTTISGGTLQIGNGGSGASIGGSSSVLDNASLVFNHADTVNFTPVISGSGGLTQMGIGTLTLTGSSTYTGTTTVRGGTLQIGNGGAGASIGSTSGVVDNASLIFDNGDNVTFGKVISGGGSLTKLGSGMLTLTGLSTVVGNVTVSAGTLQIAAGQLPAVNELVAPGTTACLVQSGGTGSVASLIVGGVDANAGFLGTPGTGGNGSYTLSGSGRLTVSGTESIGQGLSAVGLFTQTGGTNSASSLSLGGDDPSASSIGNISWGGNGSYALGGGRLAVTGTESIGQGLEASGSFTQTGGTHTVASLVLGGVDQNENGGNGSYALSGSGRLAVSGAEFIGQGLSAVGLFTQSGGTHSVTSLVLGCIDDNGNGGNGSYFLSGGVLSASGTESVGWGLSSVGSFTQTGGSQTVAGLVIGSVDLSGNGGSGSYILGGSGYLTVKGTELIGQGNSAAGVFAQTGGTHSTASLVLGGVDQTGNGGSGSYALSGNGLLMVTGYESLGQGNSTVGNFTQSGGTHSAATLVLGDIDQNGNGGSGSYTLSGSGILNVTVYEAIGQGGNPGFSAFGNFTQTGGAHSAASLVLGGIDQNASSPDYGCGGNGSYILSDGLLAVSGYESIGQGGNPGATAVGSFIQTGGTHSAAALVIGDVDIFGNGGSGSYTLSGSGLLTVTGYELIGQGGNPGTSTFGGFTQTGGTHSAASLLIGGVDQNGNAGIGFYSLSGNGVLSVAGNESIGQGLFAVGSFTQTGGTHAVTTMVVGDIDQNGNGGNGSYTLSDGFLGVTANESIGQGGNAGKAAVGSFTQTGGTHSAGSLILGGVDANDNGGSGSYALSGSGLLIVNGNESIGQGGNPGSSAAGSFTQTGGTHSVVSLVIGDSDDFGNGGTGSYTLSNGLLSVTGNEVIGQGFAVGSFTQTGGIHAAATMVIGGVDVNENGGTGAYSLSGGLLTVTGNESIGQGLNAVGSFTQTGGTHSVAVLVIGDTDANEGGSSGSYSLSGSGLLSVTSLETIGQGFGNGSFTQTGGTHAAFNLVIGGVDGNDYAGAGWYALSGGLLTVTGSESIGQGLFATGSFTQTGGTHAVASLVIGGVDGSGNGGSGSYTLSGGLLTLSSLSTTSGSATFSFGGGTLQAGADFATSLPLDLSTSGSNAIFDTNGYTMTFSGSLSGPGGLQKEGAGLLILSGTNTFSGGVLVSDGTLVVDSAHALADGSSLLIGAGAFSFNAAAASPQLPSPPLAAAAAAVPEPGTWALWLAALLAGCGVWLTAASSPACSATITISLQRQLEFPSKKLRRVPPLLRS
jgi:fibronectin-binding autotransporter adhesin